MPTTALTVTLAIAISLIATRASANECPRRLSDDGVGRSIELGTGFLLRSQKTEGNFVYGYDWHRQRMSSGDSVVRQAGATWSLGLLLQAGDATVAPHLERALRFFSQHGARDGDRRFLRYPGDDVGATGAIALVALAHVEHARALHAEGKTLPTWSRHALDGYLAQLIASRRDGGGFARSYWHADGRPAGPPSPYYDGESLLALVKAARYAGRRDLVPMAVAEAKSGYARHVTAPRLDDRDPSATKGYYQWHSMALWELATWPVTAGEADWDERLIELATWMVRDHRVLKRNRNTGYAFEGIVPAYDRARRLGDPRAGELGCAIEEGLAKLSTWQVGNPKANATIRSRPADPRAIGGVQNHARKPLLRVDVTQHLMHALVLARRHYLPTRAAAPPPLNR